MKIKVGKYKTRDGQMALVTGFFTSVLGVECCEGVIGDEETCWTMDGHYWYGENNGNDLVEEWVEPLDKMRSVSSKAAADEVLCELLTQLGYQDIVDEWRKW